MSCRPQIDIYTHGSGRNRLLGIGAVATAQDQVIKSISKTVGHHDKINIYFSQIGALFEALIMAAEILDRQPVLRRVVGITIYTSSQSALKSINNPHLQSGQALICAFIGQLTKQLKEGYSIHVQWLPADSDKKGAKLAKEAAAFSTREDWPFYPPDWADTQLRSSTWRWRHDALQQDRAQQFRQTTSGRYTRELDAALPGKHVKRLYDQLPRTQASILAQLQTGHARVNTFLYRIGKIASNECECLEMSETVEHFLFHCKIWEDLRAEMKTAMGQRYGDLSYALGGRSSQLLANGQPVDQERGWVPNLNVVKAVIQFTIKTRRLDKD